MKTDKKSTKSSGNVYADLGFENAEEMSAKAATVARIYKLLTERKLTQAKAAKILGIDQPKVSALIRGNFDGYSIDRLFRFLNALGQDVQIVIRPMRGQNSRAETKVVVA